VELFADAKATFSVDDGAKRLELTSGALACNAARQPEGRPMLLVTPNATATVIGTTFWLDVYGEETTLTVEKGTVVLAQNEQRVEVDAGKTAMAHATKGVNCVELPEAKKGSGDETVEGPWGFAFARRAQAEIWLERKQYDRARREYKAALAKAPRPMADLRSYLYMLIGDSYAREKNWIEAESAYLTAKKIGLYGDRKKLVPEKLEKVKPLADAQRREKR